MRLIQVCNKVVPGVAELLFKLLGVYTLALPLPQRQLCDALQVTPSTDSLAFRAV